MDINKEKIISYLEALVRWYSDFLVLIRKWQLIILLYHYIFYYNVLHMHVYYLYIYFYYWQYLIFYRIKLHDILRSVFVILLIWQMILVNNLEYKLFSNRPADSRFYENYSVYNEHYSVHKNEYRPDGFFNKFKIYE